MVAVLGSRFGGFLSSGGGGGAVEFTGSYGITGPPVEEAGGVLFCAVVVEEELLPDPDEPDPGEDAAGADGLDAL